MSMRQILEFQLSEISATVSTSRCLEAAWWNHHSLPCACDVLDSVFALSHPTLNTDHVKNTRWWCYLQGVSLFISVTKYSINDAVRVWEAFFEAFFCLVLLSVLEESNITVVHHFSTCWWWLPWNAMLYLTFWDFSFDKTFCQWDSVHAYLYLINLLLDPNILLILYPLYICYIEH